MVIGFPVRNVLLEPLVPYTKRVRRPSLTKSNTRRSHVVTTSAYLSRYPVTPNVSYSSLHSEERRTRERASLAPQSLLEWQIQSSQGKRTQIPYTQHEGLRKWRADRGHRGQRDKALCGSLARTTTVKRNQRVNCLL